MSYRCHFATLHICLHAAAHIHKGPHDHLVVHLPCQQGTRSPMTHSTVLPDKWLVRRKIHMLLCRFSKQFVSIRHIHTHAPRQWLRLLSCLSRAQCRHRLHARQHLAVAQHLQWDKICPTNDQNSRDNCRWMHVLTTHLWQLMPLAGE